MKLSLKWLRDFVDYQGAPDELAHLLTFAGVEVEGIHTRGAAIDQVVVAAILDSKQHPNADRLSVCHVDDGSGQPPRQIVCGAKNYKVGDKVPLALPGAVLPGEFKIKSGKLRGEASEGMLCSAKELGLGDDQSGLLILPPESQVGAPIAEIFPAETILEIEVTPNRPDLLSHIGVAREIAALTGLPLKMAATPEISRSGDPQLAANLEADAARRRTISQALSVEITAEAGSGDDDVDLCHQPHRTAGRHRRSRATSSGRTRAPEADEHEDRASDDGDSNHEKPGCDDGFLPGRSDLTGSGDRRKARRPQDRREHGGGPVSVGAEESRPECRGMGPRREPHLAPDGPE
jgi:tRNA-binding EMAP/Myf-like protein